ncbi:MAG: methyltransferase domain-containing protein [Thermodesulfobacteriota bacterium]|nr:methyltransferase domain-containing protein [Thermodesulfobacteriota bacterium]
MVDGDMRLLMNCSRNRGSQSNSGKSFARKPVLRKIYQQFYQQIAAHVSGSNNSLVVEIGAGPHGASKVIPHCLQTGLYNAPWVDRVENAYQLSFETGMVSDLIMVDVFHHLQYPGAALQEFYRVLRPGGRVILFEPCISLLGFFVYGLFHHEPMGLSKTIEWKFPDNWDARAMDYYAASANAWRVFCKNKGRRAIQKRWKVMACRRIAAISYVASGGHTKPQLYPEFLLPLMRMLDAICQMAPALFATRILVVLEK